MARITMYQPRPTPESDDFIGQETVREQSGVQALRQPKRHQSGINSTSFNLMLTSRCEILTFNRISSDYFPQMRFKSNGGRAKLKKKAFLEFAWSINNDSF